MLTKVRRTMPESSENFNNELEYIRKYQTETTELKSPTTALKKFNRGV